MYGVLKPLGNLDLREGESVKLIVLKGACGLSDAIKKISRQEHRRLRDNL
ncbi:MAG: hypothetical protein DRO15_05380 [Thermoprotei archaeon]|nr:MAG: hypothetical protein DRO15_05380 [Thermoprotei archaeon]